METFGATQRLAFAAISDATKVAVASSVTADALTSFGASCLLTTGALLVAVPD